MVDIIIVFIFYGVVMSNTFRKTLLSIYCGLPFCICSILVMLWQCNRRGGGGFFDLSGMETIILYIFCGFAFFCANTAVLSYLKQKKVMERIWVHYVCYSSSYIVVCFLSDSFIAGFHRYRFSELSFEHSYMLPFIIVLFITSIVIITNLLMKQNFIEATFEKMPLTIVMTAVLFILVLIAFLLKYYSTLSDLEKWAIMYRPEEYYN